MGALGSKIRGVGGHAAGFAFRTSRCIRDMFFMFRVSCFGIRASCFTFYVSRFQFWGRGVGVQKQGLGSPWASWTSAEDHPETRNCKHRKPSISLSEQKMNFRVSKVPQLVPGSAPTVLPELLRVRFGHPGTLVPFPNLVLGALMGSWDHSGRQIWCRKLLLSVPANELSKKKSRT